MDVCALLPAHDAILWYVCAMLCVRQRRRTIPQPVPTDFCCRILFAESGNLEVIFDWRCHTICNSACVPIATVGSQCRFHRSMVGCMIKRGTYHISLAHSSVLYTGFVLSDAGATSFIAETEISPSAGHWHESNRTFGHGYAANVSDAAVKVSSSGTLE